MTAIVEVRFADILRVAQIAGASDLHLVPGHPPAMRLHGSLHTQGRTPITAREIAEIAHALFAPSDVAQVEAGVDISTTWSDGTGNVLRVHGLRTRDGLALAARILPSHVPTLEELGLPPALTSLVEGKSGLIVFSGPTGSGKSTSLAAFVDEINRSRSFRVITVEDPVEYRHSPDRSVISQRQVGRDTTSFHDAVMGALRTDPDVIVIGEMRERDDISAALTAAETGHLVLSTLHTSDAAQTLERIVDAFSETDRTQVRAQLASSLVAIVSQRLVPNRARDGRRPVVEILRATDAVRAIVRDGRMHLLKNAISTGRALGMQTLEQHAQDLVTAGEIDSEAAAWLRVR